jgi:hypothetical protein
MTEQSAPSPSPLAPEAARPKESLLPKAPIGTPEWEAEFAALEAARESSKVYQLAFWPDDKRAMPGDFIACALFSCRQGKDSEYVERQTLASINGLSEVRRLLRIVCRLAGMPSHYQDDSPESQPVGDLTA